MPSTTNFNWTTPADTDLVKDGAAAIRTLGNNIDSSLVDLKGGTTGQVLSKNSNTDLDFTWITQNDADAIQNTIIDAKGDLIVGSAADTPARLASSAVNGNVLTVDTSTATGLKWAAPAGGGGKVLQVVQSIYSTQVTSTSTTLATTGLSASITPSATSSKVLVLVTQGFYYTSGSNSLGCKLSLYRGGSSISVIGTRLANGAPGGYNDTWAFNYLDSPSSTSSLTYETYFGIFQTTGTVVAQGDTTYSSITLLEIGA